MKKIDPAIVGIDLVWLSVLFTVAVAFICCTPSAPEPAPDFLGKWVDTSHAPLLFAVEFRPDHSVTFTVRDGGEITSITDGDWSYRAPLLITRDRTCQEGPPLRLVVCPAEADTVRPAVSGDSWPLSFLEDGQIISFNLRRVQ